MNKTIMKIKNLIKKAFKTNKVEQHYSRIRELQQNILDKLGPIGSHFVYMEIIMRLDSVAGESISYYYSECAEIIASYKNNNGEPRIIHLEYGKLDYCTKSVDNND